VLFAPKTELVTNVRKIAKEKVHLQHSRWLVEAELNY